MTATETMEQAEALACNGDANSVQLALAVLDMSGDIDSHVRQRAHRLLALNHWRNGGLTRVRTHFNEIVALMEASPISSRALLGEAIGDVALTDYYLGDHRMLWR